MTAVLSAVWGFICWLFGWLVGGDDDLDDLGELV